MKKLLWILSFAILSATTFGVGTVQVTRVPLDYTKGVYAKRVEVVTIVWTADASNASVPAAPAGSSSIPLYGFALKGITDPGSPAPNDDYDVELLDPVDNATDALGGALINRDATTTEHAPIVLSGGATPVFLAGEYRLKVTQTTNSGTGKIVLYLVD